MGFDIISWTTSYLLKRVLNVFFTSSISKRFVLVVNKWANELPVEASIYSEAIYNNTHLFNENDHFDERPKLQGLTYLLEQKKLPSKEDWFDVFYENWKLVRKSETDLQPFFNLENPNKYLEILAEAIYDLFLEEEIYFRKTILYKIDQKVKSKKNSILSHPSIDVLNRKSLINFRTINTRKSVGSLLKSKNFIEPLLINSNYQESDTQHILKLLLSNNSLGVLIHGEAGTGKTISLIKIYLEYIKSKNAIFLDQYHFDAILQSEFTNNKKKIQKALFIDGLDEVLLSFNKEKAFKISLILKKFNKVIVTCRSDLINRSDFKNQLHFFFDESFKLSNWKYKDVLNFLGETNDSKITALIQKTNNKNINALFISMIDIVRKQDKESLNENSRLTYHLDFEYLTMLYQQFEKSWFKNEFEEIDIHSLEMCHDELLKISSLLHINRTGGNGISKYIPNGKLSFEQRRAVKSFLKMGGVDGDNIIGFIHVTLLDYFTATALISGLENECNYESALYYPNLYEVNIYVRGILSQKCENPYVKNQLSIVINEKYQQSINSRDRNNILHKNLRNNLIYMFGRLPNLNSEDIQFLESAFDIESYTLARYSIGMTGIYQGSEKLNKRILDAVMYPKNDDDENIRIANLYCHLHYYGDISQLALPSNKIGWGLTRNRLSRHFDTENIYYKPFWLIDIVTIVQLNELYGEGEELIKTILNHLNVNSNKSEIYKKVIEYIEEKII